MDFAQWVGADETKRVLRICTRVRTFTRILGPEGALVALWVALLVLWSRLGCFGRALVGLWSYHPLVLC